MWYMCSTAGRMYNMPIIIRKAFQYLDNVLMNGYVYEIKADEENLHDQGN